MANYNDYQLDEMENAAVNKSKNLKRGLAVGAGVLGAGGAAAFATERIVNSGSDDPAELTEENLVAGANTGVEEASEHTHETHETHVNHHIVAEEPIVPDTNENFDEPMDVEVTETAVLLDEEGNIMSAYDAGKINGKDFVVIDSDLNGKGDILAYDENGNGIFEDNEITQIDNSTYEIGKGQDFKVFAQDENGNMNLIHQEPNYIQHGDVAHEPNPGIGDIHNDFYDAKSGETYHGDFAENNPDYNNHGGEQYSAGVDHPAVADNTIQNDFDGMPEPSYGYQEDVHQDYGYSEPASDFTADHSTEVYDDPIA